jgi:hypothetical protein
LLAIPFVLLLDIPISYETEPKDQSIEVIEEEKSKQLINNLEVTGDEGNQDEIDEINQDEIYEEKTNLLINYSSDVK